VKTPRAAIAYWEMYPLGGDNPFVRIYDRRLHSHTGGDQTMKEDDFQETGFPRRSMSAESPVARRRNSTFIAKHAC